MSQQRIHETQLQLIQHERPLASDAISSRHEQTSVLIDAKDDSEAIRTYLAIRCAKATTRKTVQRDLRKLAVFMTLHGLSRLDQIKAEHGQQFQDWLMNPPQELCSGKSGRPPPLTRREEGELVPNPDWKPFRAALSPVMTNQTVQKIKSMTSWLVKAGYLSGNPWELLTPVTKAKTLNQEETEDTGYRELPLRCIKAVVKYLDDEETIRGQTRRNAQRRWCFMFYLYTAARISSGCTASLDDLYIDRKGQKQLTLTVKGQGVRRKDVAWIPELEEEYQRYRQAMGLDPIKIDWGTKRKHPREGVTKDKGPRHLLLPITISKTSKRSKALSYQSVHTHLVSLFRDTAETEQSKKNPSLETWEIGILNDATGHWIRHGTAAILGVHARHQLGHHSQRQTDQYQARNENILRENLSKIMTDQSPYDDLLNEPESVRIAWIEKLKNSLL